MDNFYEKGLEKRKETLGKEYVEKTIANANDFNWGDECIDAKTRSMMNLAMIAALGKMHEWELHCRGAIKNGVTKEQLRAIVHVIAIYCGVPQGVECFRSANKIIEETGI
jgi:4-carboxymuconolactone decarboxylase